jgi:hypothetical protein
MWSRHYVIPNRFRIFYFIFYFKLYCVNSVKNNVIYSFMFLFYTNF